MTLSNKLDFFNKGSFEWLRSQSTADHGLAAYSDKQLITYIQDNLYQISLFETESADNTGKSQIMIHQENVRRGIADLYRRGDPYLRRSVRAKPGRMLTKEEFEDIIAETWNIAIKRLTNEPDFQLSSLFTSLLYGISRNLCLASNRVANEQHSDSFDAMPESVHDKALYYLFHNDTSKNDVDSQVHKEAQTMVAAIMKQVTRREKEILMLHYFKEMTFAEIGAKLGMKEGTVRTAHFRLLKKLRKRFGSEDNNRSGGQ